MNEEALHFTVVDLETTGLFSRGTDRVVEIAALKLDSEGNILDEYCALVNPGRDIGPTRIHGIEAWEVKEAPMFPDILGDVAFRLCDTIAVAHNAMFDLGFLSAEFERAGNPLPEIRYLCTLQMAGEVDADIPSRKLDALCEYFEIPLPRAHSAVDDARATAGLLRTFLRAINGGIRRNRQALPFRVFAGAGTAWPAQKLTGRMCARGQQRSPTELGADFISRLVERLPHSSVAPGHVQEYLSLLDEVLEDRRVTADESEKLFEVAAGFGLTREQVASAHSEYLQSLVSTALEDQVLSEFELRDLEAVSRLLSVSDDVMQSMIEAARSQRPKSQSEAVASATADNLQGRLICFTGDLTACLGGKPIDREFAERTASDRGMIIKTGVSRKLDFLVAADPDSNSGKARKAREYGTRIISEAQFWRMMGVQVE
ncbi:MAG: hypothetical protein BroJett003_05990 [Planctomycetota bacterium]|nr:MAG: hypothetical protein BroJett003_05990 [Planctomycetota bacterium]